jgi:hypothetical protein
MSNEPVLVRRPILAWAPSVACLVLGLGVPWLVGLRENCVLQICLFAWFYLLMGLAYVTLLHISARLAKKLSQFPPGMTFRQQVAHSGTLMLGLLVAAQLYVWSRGGHDLPSCDGITFAGARLLLIKLWLATSVACVAMLTGMRAKANQLVLALLIVMVSVGISMAVCLYSSDKDVMVYIWQLGSLASASMLVGTYIEEELAQPDAAKPVAGAT